MSWFPLGIFLFYSIQIYSVRRTIYTAFEFTQSSWLSSASMINEIILRLPNISWQTSYTDHNAVAPCIFCLWWTFCKWYIINHCAFNRKNNCFRIIFLAKNGKPIICPPCGIYPSTYVFNVESVTTTLFCLLLRKVKTV